MPLSHQLEEDSTFPLVGERLKKDNDNTTENPQHSCTGDDGLRIGNGEPNYRTVHNSGTWGHRSRRSWNGTQQTSGAISCGGANLGAGYVLTSAELFITGNILNSADTPYLSTVSVSNSNSGAATVSFSTLDTFSVDSTSSNSLTNFSGINPSGMFQVSASIPLNYSICGTCEQTFNVSGSGNGSGTDTNGSDLSNWSGANGFNFIVDTVTGESESGGGGFVTFGQATYVDATAYVEYNYTTTSTTPEPTTMALLGGALVGLGLIGKRFKKS